MTALRLPGPSDANVDSLKANDSAVHISFHETFQNAYLICQVLSHTCAKKGPAGSLRYKDHWMKIYPISLRRKEHFLYRPGHRSGDHSLKVTPGKIRSR